MYDVSSAVSLNMEVDYSQYREELVEYLSSPCKIFFCLAMQLEKTFRSSTRIVRSKMKQEKYE